MEHMCTRCARAFLQSTRARGRPYANARTRPFSSISSRFAPGPIDLSVPLDSDGKSEDRSKAPSAAQPSQKAEHVSMPPSRFRKAQDSYAASEAPRIRSIRPDSSRPSGSSIPDQRLRRAPSATTAPGQRLQRTPTAPPAKSQVLQRTGKAPPRSAALGSVLSSSQTGSNAPRQGRNALQPQPEAQVAPGDAEVDEEYEVDEDEEHEEEEEDQDDEDIQGFANKEEEIEGLQAALSEDFVGEFNNEQVLVMTSRLKLLSDETISDEERNLLEQLSEPEQFNELPDDQIDSMVERLNTLADSSAKQAEDAASKEPEDVSQLTGEHDLDSMSEEDNMAWQMLSEDNENLTDEQRLAAFIQLDLIAADGSLLEPEEARKRWLVKQLSDENIDKLSEERQKAIIQELDLVAEDGKTLLDPTEKYGYLLEPYGSASEKDAEDKPEISDEEMADLQKLSDENIDNLSEEELAEVAGRLDLIGEDGKVLDPSQYPYSRADAQELINSAPANEEDAADDTAITKEQEKKEDEQDDLTEDEEVDKYIEEVIDPSPLPQESLPYTPKENSTEELRLDWPNTPLTGSGLTESVIQKVTWLAKRLPHGHWTPSQVAERYEEGYMVRFANDQEKDTVLKLAADLANARASKMTQRSGEKVEAQNMQFSSLMENQQQPESRKMLDAMARGVYPTPEKQGRAFMDGVVKQLESNETYRPEDSSKFMERVQRLIGQVSGTGKGSGKK